jgi:hypothetical protein
MFQLHQVLKGKDRQYEVILLLSTSLLSNNFIVP